MRISQLSWIAAATLWSSTVAAVTTPSVVIDLPYIGEPADNTLSPMQERELGARVMGQLYGGEYVLEDPELADYITSIGWKLAASSATRPPQLTFFLVKDDRINAFALPGGYIGFNAGLLLAAENESEVAGVMGHELAHVTQRHIARTAQDTEVATIATWLAVLAAIIAGSADPDVIIGALSVGQTLNYQRQVSFTRAHEQEADRIGIQTMAKAGFDPNGMASFFQKISQQSRLYGSGTPEILRTHPLSTNRIAEARARADSLPPVKLTPSLEFELMRARTRVLAADLPSQAVSDFEARLRNDPGNSANQYGLAFALSQMGQAARALTLAERLAEQYPAQVNIQLLLGQLYLEQGQKQRAVATLERTVKAFPRSAPARLAYAEALLSSGQSDRARQLLLSGDPAYGTPLQTYRLLAQAARESGNLAESSFQMAQFLFLRGDAGLALAQIDAGLRLPDLDDKQRARLLAKRREVRDRLPSNWRPLDQRP
ncbi:M48 family metalloprotease [Sinimarinibacterium sp. NLF-5-8]|uniref:M48 family metalloprotease n=1 Tax=Sinimarinibacterium sp. NLF-5-8 TaxID=2698684 RepID=UPI00137BCE9D|nr:M48 family metalloprotease [Sinimarinibacterium sp. NLF-5-8]QHS09177.1 M48 family metallopeptidase [Sinimarinibacterium sp. NLF-5-8]